MNGHSKRSVQKANQESGDVAVGGSSWQGSWDVLQVGKDWGRLFMHRKKGIKCQFGWSLSPIIINSSRKSSISTAPLMSSLFRAQNGTRQVSPV